MNTIPTLLRGIALLTAASLLALTGCSSDAEAPASPTTSPSAPSEPTKTAEQEPVASKPLIKALPGKDNPAQEVSGIVSWEVQPGKGLNAAVAKKVEVAADAFINEHLLRPDRWQGKHIVKTGEMDDVKAKYTPYMYGLVERAVGWWHANVEKHGGETDGWPKNQLAQADDKARSMGGMFVTQVLTDHGKGAVKNEMKRRVVYVAGGSVMAYVEVVGRRVNNTGNTKSITAKLTFKKVDGKWLIDGVFWDRTDD